MHNWSSLERGASADAQLQSLHFSTPADGLDCKDIIHYGFQDIVRCIGALDGVGVAYGGWHNHK